MLQKHEENILQKRRKKNHCKNEQKLTRSNKKLKGIKAEENVNGCRKKKRVPNTVFFCLKKRRLASTHKTSFVRAFLQQISLHKLHNELYVHQCVCVYMCLCLWIIEEKRRTWKIPSKMYRLDFSLTSFYSVQFHCYFETQKRNIVCLRY